jgi:shikimate dehydrogenase
VAERPRLAVLGSPIGHSRSPELHLAAYGVLGLDWRYDRVEVDDAGLAGFLDDLSDEWRGLSLTMPLKRRVAALVPHIDEVARLTHQGNTILLEGGRPVRAFNTDVHGVVQAFADAGVTAADHAIVLGGGATAESAVVALRQLGADVTVAVRSPDKVAGVFGDDVGITSLHDIEYELSDADAVVSTIPNGAEFALPVPDRLGGTLLDVAYHPWPSALASRWSEAGGVVISGLEMLLHQAVHQIRIFVAGSPEVPLRDEAAVIAAMRAAVAPDAGASTAVE